MICVIFIHAYDMCYMKNCQLIYFRNETRHNYNHKGGIYICRQSHSESLLLTNQNQMIIWLLEVFCRCVIMEFMIILKLMKKIVLGLYLTQCGKKKRLQSLSFWGFCLDFGLVLRVELALFSCSKYHAHHNSQRVIEECVSIE